MRMTRGGPCQTTRIGEKLRLCFFGRESAWQAPEKGGQVQCGQTKKRRPLNDAAFARVAGNYWMASFLAVAPGFFGRVSSSTPSLYLAWAWASSTSFARVKLRATLPL